MKTESILKLFRLTLILSLWNGGPALYGFAQPVTINFDSVAPFTDFPIYSEHGFTLTPNFGEVRINNGFAPFSNAAQPSFGFGQGVDSGFTFTRDMNLPFSLLSIDLLEATVFPDRFGVTLIGRRSDSGLVTQTFTLDGIAGAQAFTLPPSFSDLISLRIGEDTANGFSTDVVQIDNVQFAVVPEPSTWSLFVLAGGVTFLWGFYEKRQNETPNEEGWF